MAKKTIKQWEYLVKVLDYQISAMKQMRILDGLGKEGWELINCVYNKNAGTVSFYFKREGEVIKY